nr:esterase family protein [Clostridiales bacterium]
MALCQVRFFSESLGMQCDMNVLLPQKRSPRPDGKFPVLYLLHGMSGDSMSWLQQTNIERYADGLDLALVMPSAQMSWYVNLKC